MTVRHTALMKLTSIWRCTDPDDEYLNFSLYTQCIDSVGPVFAHLLIDLCYLLQLSVNKRVMFMHILAVAAKIICVCVVCFDWATSPPLPHHPIITTMTCPRPPASRSCTDSQQSVVFLSSYVCCSIAICTYVNLLRYVLMCVLISSEDIDLFVQGRRLLCLCLVLALTASSIRKWDRVCVRAALIMLSQQLLNTCAPPVTYPHSS